MKRGFSMLKHSRWLIVSIFALALPTPSSSNDGRGIDYKEAGNYDVAQSHLSPLSFKSFYIDRYSSKYSSLDSSSILKYSATLSDTDPTPRNYVLVIPFPWKSTQAFLTPNKGERYELPRLDYRYDSYSISDQDLPAHIELWLDPGGYPTPRINPQIYSQDAWIVSANQDNLIEGIGFGIIAIMIIYNLGMYLSFRHGYFLYYCTYAISLLAVLIHSAGYVYFIHPLIMLASGGSGIFLLFMVGDLLLDSNHRKLRRAQWLLILVSCLAIIGNVFHLIAVSSLVLSVSSCVGFAIFTSLYRLRQGEKVAIHLLAGWLVLAVSIGLSMMVNYESLAVLAWSPFIGIVLETCIFSFAMSIKARQTELSALAAKNHSYQQLQKVFYPHQIQQMEQGNQLESTMPCGTGKAIALSFDAVASSEIDPSLAFRFFRELFSQFNDRISQGYRADPLQASAHRVKEMGDGFLCTVNFPFLAPDQSAGGPEKEAILLAKDMIKIFQRCRQRFSLEGISFCTAGLAKGDVLSFFPSSEPVDYDLFGEALILATRYEEFAMKLGKSRHLSADILAVQSEVFEALPSQSIDLEKIDLNELGFQVRNDPNAKTCYILVDHGESPEASNAAS
ncbi:7TM diverse intracellular signaling domain-containing protein [Pseudobacteriovorax antillogorgiicola]|uniref:Adenylate cyclase, class 3 n=1 Tax=Pseudobacteriovorax antillogorgiicola TaxID=1513793 RepID=A0A1Y6CJ92_9BACT|nr:7TM diverse intracellular signaling domain-containing protein [Pseudobacteriovorax antillogorgiicola]TCS46140.1 class 3 adenylate cyclase [Pseudobacteriovorax antillogorgiicola]SMF69698.1 Adenylate cyclase, class 3 [Pseudobacteriovorax antillogorgiicola]